MYERMCWELGLFRYMLKSTMNVLRLNIKFIYFFFDLFLILSCAFSFCYLSNNTIECFFFFIYML